MIRSKPLRYLSSLAAGVLIINPTLGLISFVLLRFSQNVKRDQGLWALLWLGTSVLLLPSALVHGEFLYLGQLLLAWLASSVLVAAGLRFVRLGLSVALIIACLLGTFQRSGSDHLWLDTERSATLNELLTQRSILTKALPVKAGQPAAFVKTWSLPVREEVELSFDVRKLSGEGGVGWYAYNPQFEFEKLEDFVRIYPPDETADRRYITREINTGTALANRTFRARVELRSSTPFVGRGCQGVRIQVVSGGGEGRCRDIRLTNTWRVYDFSWTVPPEVESPSVRLSLYNIDVPSYDVRAASLAELKEGEWREFELLEPAGLLVRALPMHRALAPRLHLNPGIEWQRATLAIPAEELAEKDSLAFLAQVDGDSKFAFKNISLSLDAPQQPTPLAPKRQSMWFSHPNMAGQSLATAGLVLLSLMLVAARSKLTWSYLGIAAALSAVFLTASRAAWLALLLGSGMAWLVTSKRRRHLLLKAAIMLCLTMVVGALLGGRLGFNVEALNRISRLAIWRVAWDAFLDNPWFGIGSGAAFLELWRAQSPDTGAIVHAHNLWLQFAASYGLFGLMAALWLTLGLSYLAWRWGRFTGIILVIPVLMMNVFDYTLFHSGILFPLILGLNTLRSSAVKSKANASV